MYTVYFLFLRIIFQILFGRENIKKYPRYMYYVSFFFQIILLPLLFFFFNLKLITSDIIYNTSIAYFASDFPQLIYLKDKYMIIHHILSILLLSFGFYLQESTQYYCITHLLILEFGSSFLSIPHIFRKDILFKLRPFIFFISRLISLYTLNKIIFNVNINLIYRKQILTLNTIIYIYNLYLLITMTKINKKIENYFRFRLINLLKKN